MTGSRCDIPAKIVFVRNRNNRKDWIALISTDVTLSEEEIIQAKMQKYSRIIFSCSGWSPYSKGGLGCSGCGKFEDINKNHQGK